LHFPTPHKLGRFDYNKKSFLE